MMVSSIAASFIISSFIAQKREDDEAVSEKNRAEETAKGTEPSKKEPEEPGKESETKKKKAKKKEDREGEELVEELEGLMDKKDGYSNAKYVLTNEPFEPPAPLDEDGEPMENAGSAGSMPGAGFGNDEPGTPASSGSVVLPGKANSEHDEYMILMLLDNYINEMKKDGVPKEFIRKRLEEKGWAGEIIERLL